MVNADRIRHILKQHGLSCARRRNQQCSLSLTNRTQQVHDSHRQRLGTNFQLDLLKRVNRREVVEVFNIQVLLRSEPINEFYFAKSRSLITRALTHVTANQHALSQLVFFYQ